MDDEWIEIVKKQVNNQYSRESGLCPLSDEKKGKTEKESGKDEKQPRGGDAIDHAGPSKEKGKVPEEEIVIKKVDT